MLDFILSMVEVKNLVKIQLKSEILLQTFIMSFSKVNLLVFKFLGFFFVNFLFDSVNHVFSKLEQVKPELETENQLLINWFSVRQIETGQ